MADRWFGVNSTNLHSFCGEKSANRLADALDGDDFWEHSVNEEHWFIIDLLQVYDIKQVRGRSCSFMDPTLVDIYVSRNTTSWGQPVATNIATWQDTSSSWQNVTITEKIGRYIKVVIKSTESGTNYLIWGGGFVIGCPFMSIFDIYLDDVAGAQIVTTSGEAGLTAQQQCEAAGKYWYNGTCNDDPQYERDVYVSGYLTRFQKRQVIGYYPASGDLRSITVNASGHVYTDVEIEVSSGLHVLISGQHVFVESGVHVASGLHVVISGQHLFQESGAFVNAKVQSGASMDALLCGLDGISGIIPCTAVYEQKPYSGHEVGFIPFAHDVDNDQWWPLALDSAQRLWVLISGQGVISEIGCADTVRTGGLKSITTLSGGEEICQITCSGPVHNVIVKNISGQADIFIGGVDCKPYSGFGFLLASEEAITLDVCNVCNIWACANTSGELLTYIGTNY